MKHTENLCVFLTGSVIYGIVEMLWRGYTHWSMVISGGFCFLVMHIFDGRIKRAGLITKCLFGCAVITAVELAVGIAVNLWLKLDVWDYSRMRWNLFGQICPTYSVLWFLISVPAFFLSRTVRKFFRLIEDGERGGA